MVSSQGLTSMMMRDLVSLAFSAPRFLAAAINASFSSFAFFSSCAQNTKLQAFALMHVMCNYLPTQQNPTMPAQTQGDV